MNAFKILTTRNFDKQVLLDGDVQLSEELVPRTSVESRLAEDLTNERAISESKDSQPLLIGYDNTLVIPPVAADRFPIVNFAHYVLADTLRSNLDVMGKRFFADLGCGAGFLGNFIAKNNDWQKIVPGKIIFADLVPEALQSAIRAYAINNNLNEDDFPKPEMIPHGIRYDFDNPHSHIDPKVSIDLKVGDVRETIVGGSELEVTMASPVYIPEICEVFPQAYEIFGEVSKKQGADFYFSHSSLADKVVEQAAKNTGAVLRELSTMPQDLVITTVDSGRAGIENILDEATIEKLIPLGLSIKGKEDKKYGHEIRVSKFEYK